MAVSPARVTPSSASIAPSARPVKPMPRSARKARRECWPQGHAVMESVDWCCMALPDRNEVVVIEEGPHEAFAGPRAGFGGVRPGRQVALFLEGLLTELPFPFGRHARQDLLEHRGHERLRLAVVAIQPRSTGLSAVLPVGHDGSAHLVH